MAKVYNNIFIRGLSGSLGDQFVIRKGKAGNTIISAKPTFDSNRDFNDTQLAHQDAFREAIAYAKTAKNNPVYIAKAEGTTKSAFNLAVADCFSPPQVLEIDASGWTGAIGQSIRVKVQEDIHVARVHLIIDNGQRTVNTGQETIFEQGELVRSDGLWWTYTTTTQIPMSPAPRVLTAAYDLPGNTNGMLWSAS